MSKLTLTSPTELTNLLREFDVDLKYSLGQNFLVSKAIIDKIIALSGCNECDNVLEVGCGAGTLTVAMLSTGAKVASIEKDEGLYSVVEHTTDEWQDNFHLIKGDALALKLDDMPFSPNKFIANLPYNVAATLILDYFQNINSLDSACVMVQKEVADRICAKPGNKNYGAYTVKLSLYASAVDSFFVGRNNFLPAPRVDSAVVLLERCERDLDLQTLRIACKIADAAFCNRRKTILNSCCTFFGREHSQVIKDWLRECNVDERVRAEKFDTGVFLTLASNAPSFMA